MLFVIWTLLITDDEGQKARNFYLVQLRIATSTLMASVLGYQRRSSWLKLGHLSRLLSGLVPQVMRMQPHLRLGHPLNRG